MTCWRRSRTQPQYGVAFYGDHYRHNGITSLFSRLSSYRNLSYTTHIEETQGGLTRGTSNSSSPCISRVRQSQEPSRSQATYKEKRPFKMPTSQDIDSGFPTPPSPPTPGPNTKSSIAKTGQGESRATFPRGLEATNKKTSQVNFVFNSIIEQQEITSPVTYSSLLFPFFCFNFLRPFLILNLEQLFDSVPTTQGISSKSRF